MPNMYRKNCKQCGDEFIASSSNTVYCGKECRDKGHNPLDNLGDKRKEPWTDSGNLVGKTPGTLNKATIARNKLMELKKLQEGETVLAWIERLMRDGDITPDSHPALVTKVMDKQVGNAPQVQLNADLSDTMHDEEMGAIFEKAGIVKKGTRPTKH